MNNRVDRQLRRKYCGARILFCGLAVLSSVEFTILFPACWCDGHLTLFRFWWLWGILYSVAFAGLVYALPNGITDVPTRVHTVYQYTRRTLANFCRSIVRVRSAPIATSGELPPSVPGDTFFPLIGAPLLPRSTGRVIFRGAAIFVLFASHIWLASISCGWHNHRYILFVPNITAWLYCVLLGYIDHLIQQLITERRIHDSQFAEAPEEARRDVLGRQHDNYASLVRLIVTIFVAIPVALMWSVIEVCINTPSRMGWPVFWACCVAATGSAGVLLGVVQLLEQFRGQTLDDMLISSSDSFQVQANGNMKAADNNEHTRNA